MVKPIKKPVESALLESNDEQKDVSAMDESMTEDNAQTKNN